MVRRTEMSGLYNMLFGENDQRGALLSMIGMENFDFGRFRDVYVTDEYIVVHTRNGDGNREDYGYVFEAASENQYYSHNEDCDFDWTYADIFFYHPKEYKELLQEMAKGTATPSEKWEMMLKALKG
jgi:hypothetical protein